MDARPFEEPKEDSGEGESNGRMILDVAHPYCYEVLRLDRNGAALKEFFKPHWEDREVLLRYGERWVSCTSMKSPGEGRKKGAGKRAPSRGAEPENFAPANEMMPAGAWESSSENSSESSSGSSSGGSVPFEGLVREVTRWLSGDVILARRGADEEDENGEREEEISGKEEE
jgi:hypothetical protein